MVVEFSTSMKGGRTAPRDNLLIMAEPRTILTSMKGGRTAPRDGGPDAELWVNGLDFNEGGADCPPRLVS